MLADATLDAVFDLAPAPLHGTLNRAILDAGVACFSEKPLASSVAEADALIELAAKRGVPSSSRPDQQSTARVRWLVDLAASGRLGSPTLAVAHHADPGPAAWREYTGDPTPFYREGVGPVFDHGVYRLHEMTTVLGPVRRVQAMGSIAIPRRRIRGGPSTAARSRSRHRTTSSSTSSSRTARWASCWRASARPRRSPHGSSCTSPAGP